MEENTYVTILRHALTARRFEERVIQLAMAGELPATLHPGSGQELAQCAALAALRPDDPMFYGHRGSAYWIARGLPLDRILCDIACKEGGTNRGKGGVMHVVDPGRGIMGESGTLGGNFVLGVGNALADQMLGSDAVTVIFFGDGTSNRGQFHEAANFAAVRRLPVIFFCENNGWAVSVSAKHSTAVANIADRAAGYAMPGVVVDGGDVDAVYDATRAAAERARRGEGPTLIEAKVERLLGHYIGDPLDYRSADEQAAVKSRDPLPVFVQAMIDRGLVDAAQVKALEDEADAQIEAGLAVERAQVPAAPRTAFDAVYAA
ncbi:MAG: thiamine pyrophosphate-dependent dehydrogenase E1 component subunit alpha [Gammaproteobacteria bacterium]